MSRLLQDWLEQTSTTPAHEPRKTRDDRDDEGPLVLTVPLEDDEADDVAR